MLLNMIQRIQSLFLFGVIAISVVLFFVPLSEKSSISTESGQPVTLTLALNPVNNGESVVMDINYVLLMLNLLVLAASVYIIFLFKNRQAQMRLCALTGLLAALSLVAVFYFSDQLAGEGNPHYLAGTYLIALQVFFILAARRFIRKDEMLVRASQRIR